AGGARGGWGNAGGGEGHGGSRCRRRPARATRAPEGRAASLPSASAGAPSAHLPQMPHLGRAALHGIELTEDGGGFAGDFFGNVVEHAHSLFRRRLLPAAAPA